MEDDVPLEANQLPRGYTPLWLDVPDHTSHLEMLMRVSQIREIRGLSVTVRSSNQDSTLVYPLTLCLCYLLVGY